MTREEAIKYAKFRLECYSKGDGEYTEHGEFLVAAIKALQEPERKKGRWASPTDKCPVCGVNKFKDLDADIWADWNPPFCPNCGADMRGDEK